MTRLSEFACGILLFTASAAAQQYIISTYAGGAPPTTPAPAMSVSIGWGQGVATDAAGNVYFSSSDLNSVFKLDPGGVLTRVAGNSRPGFSGDGGPAVDAQLNGPIGVALDAASNLFILDQNNYRIRRVSARGIITTVAGDGIYGSTGDGGPAAGAQISAIGMASDAAGDLFVAESCGVRKVSTNGIIATIVGSGVCGFGGDGGPATAALVNGVYSLAIDGAANLFIATQWDGIREISANGTIFTVTNGNPYGKISVDGAGNLFIAEFTKQYVSKLSPGGTITTVAGNGTAGFGGDGGPATAAQLYNPDSVAVDSAGNMFIAGPVSIRRVSPTGIITSAAGDGWIWFSGDGGPATKAQLNTPNAIATDSAGNLFIGDAGNGRIRKVSPAGIITTVAGGGLGDDGGPAIAAWLSQINGLATDAAGNLYIADGNRVRKVAAADGIITTVAGGPSLVLGDGGPATSAQLRAAGVAVDKDGALYIADSSNNRVRKVSSSGIITTVAGTGIQGFSGDGGPAALAQFDNPSVIAVDGAGNLFILDYNNIRIREVSSTGTIATVAGSGANGFSGDGGLATSAELSYPNGVAVDGMGNLFIADTNNSRIRKVSSSGLISTVAGDGFSPACYAGEGGPATGGVLTMPLAVTVDGAGNIYVAATGNFDYQAFDEGVNCSAIRILRPSNSSVLIGAVTDAASTRATAISPGKIVAIYGAGLGPSQLIQNQPANALFSTDLAGTKVSFNGIAAPIVYTSATQVSAIVPYVVSGATAQVTVTYQGQASDRFEVKVAQSAPSFFTANQTGAGQAAAINALDGTVNTAVKPVKIGGYISLYATGEGQTAPPGVDGKLGSSTPAHPILPVTATVGGMPAVVQYAGGVFGQVAGLMQVNVQIPSGVLPSGYVPVVLQVGPVTTTPDAVCIAVSEK